MSLVLRNWNDLDRSLATFFPGFFPEGRYRVVRPAAAPRLTSREEEGGYVVEADLPGLPAEDVNISLDGNVLTIAVDEVGEEAEGRGRWTRGFRRSFTLPADVDVDGIDAKLEHGVLVLSLPKVAAPEPRRIEVKH